VAKLFGILLVVIGVWVGMTVYLEGVDHAFGGVFAAFAGDDEDGFDGPDEPEPPVTRRAGDAFQRAYNRSVDRVDEALAEPPQED
jgi:hypothetical protein